MKKKTIAIITVIILIIIAVISSIYIADKNKEKEQKNKETFEKNIINPDRIIYKNQEKYGIFETHGR